MGSLSVDQVSMYERRIDEIGRDMDDLDVEEIKNHVLRHHIMPLSRPGTPMSDTGRPMSAAYAHMDDLTALITATIVQALPNLAKLTRLMNIWSIRLLIIRRSVMFLTTIADAEATLRSAWEATEFGTKDHQDRRDPSETPLSREVFYAMKLAVERRVAKAGRHLDYMLDTLEGREDTLPDSWIDRMDALERDYGNWVAVCERQIRQAEWARLESEIYARHNLHADDREGSHSPLQITDASSADLLDHAQDDSRPLAVAVEIYPSETSPNTPSYVLRFTRDGTTEPSPDDQPLSLIHI